MAYSVGWMSGGGPGSFKLLDFIYRKIERGELDIEIPFVFCNREPGENNDSDDFFGLARRYGSDVVAVSSRKFNTALKKEDRERWRAEYHRRALELLDQYNTGIDVLAGYKLIVSPEMCDARDMANLHPALPGGPAGTWQDVIKQVIGERKTEHGATMQKVTAELDRGDPITYFRFPIRGDGYDALWRKRDLMEDRDVRDDTELFRRIREDGFRREPHLLVDMLDKFAGGLMWISDGRVYSKEGRVRGGYDVTEEIDSCLAGHV